MGDRYKHRKKKHEDDSLNKKVIDELAEELGISKTKIKHAISHFFGWQRDAFDSLEYNSYLWRYFGTFTVIQSRYKHYLKKQQLKQQQTITNKKELNNGKIEKGTTDQNESKEE